MCWIGLGWNRSRRTARFSHSPRQLKPCNQNLANVGDEAPTPQDPKFLIQKSWFTYSHI